MTLQLIYQSTMSVTKFKAYPCFLEQILLNSPKYQLPLTFMPRDQQKSPQFNI